LRPAEATVYSPTTLEHFRNPRNVGRLPNANAVGRVDDRETENLVAIYLRIEEGRVVAARFRTLGCSACIAASSMVTVLAQGRTLHDASTITAEAILEALDGLPPAKRHCATLTAQALAAALASYVSQHASGDPS